MLFNSLHFLVFFPVAVVVYFLAPMRWRWVWLLATSYYFYAAWEPRYALLLLVSTLIDYFVALRIDAQQDARKRRYWLWFGLAVSLSVLSTFKYFNFFAESLELGIRLFSPDFELPRSTLLLPVGISFYTFQTLSYTIDVYRGRQQAERHLGHFALFVSFFPQLVAGPVERAGNLLPQFRQRFAFDASRVSEGLTLMAWGFFQKVVVGDRLRSLVDPIFADPELYSGPWMLFATVMFTVRIYCDFAGYSNIAIGAARVMGFQLMTNFDRPYQAKSIAEYWQRWHISLSSWFRDYVYIPLGGNRGSVTRWQINLFLVFALSGVWHGAGANFVVWGCLHGIWVVSSNLTRSLRDRLAEATGYTRIPRLRGAVAIATTFMTISIAFILFRAHSLSDGLYMLAHLPSGWATVGRAGFLDQGLSNLGVLRVDVLLSLLFIFAMEVVQWFQVRPWAVAIWKRVPIVRWLCINAMLAAIALFGNYESHAFIYFQF